MSTIDANAGVLVREPEYTPERSEASMESSFPKNKVNIQLIESTKITAKLNTSKTYPEVKFEDDTGEILLTVRAKTENKPSGEQYIRNYVEKGPLMGKLVATYA